MIKKDATKKVSTKTQKTTKTKSKKPLESPVKKTVKKKTETKKKVNTVKKRKVETKNTRPVKKVAKATSFPIVEYYDLPYKYDQTTVKVLAQTPKVLFVYWDISEILKQEFPDNSYPVLIVHNTTLNYAYEVVIDDFANSWYLHINDPSSHYVIDYGRKLKNNPGQYFYITTSNVLEAPNDHILFEKAPEYVEFKNIKTGYHKKIKFKTSSVYHIYKDLSKELIHSMPTSNMNIPRR